YTPLAELRKNVHVFFYGKPGEPQKDTYVPFFPISYNFVYVNLWIGGKGIGGTFGPSFVHNDIWNSILCRKIDEIFIGIHIKSRDKFYIRTVGLCSIPPFPAGLSRLNPV